MKDWRQHISDTTESGFIASEIVELKHNIG